MKDREKLNQDVSEWMRDHHSVTDLAELREIGATYGMVRARLARGEWDSPYPGVFRNCSAPRTTHQALRAACLVTHGAVSDASAAWDSGLLVEVPSPLEVSIGSKTQMTRKKLDFVVHQRRDLDPAVIMMHNGIPVTKPLRTLVDLAATGTKEQLTEAVDKALAKRLVSVAGLQAEICRLSKKGRPGVGVLRQHLLDQGFLDAPPPSVLEARVRRLVGRLGLGEPRVEVKAGKEGQYRVDVAWEEVRFAVEADGYRWHFSPKQKARDELRRQRLREAGWTLVVFDWWQITKQAAWVGNEIRSTYLRLVAGASQQGASQ